MIDVFCICGAKAGIPPLSGRKRSIFATAKRKTWIFAGPAGVVALHPRDEDADVIIRGGWREEEEHGPNINREQPWWPWSSQHIVGKLSRSARWVYQVPRTPTVEGGGYEGMREILRNPCSQKFMQRGYSHFHFAIHG